ncbi:MAG: hypothetical protein IAF58_03780, partial [Leptolyngbya sp.]|nr:hypothetical protein [Candidatus Melainabacteria bacterium]
MRLTILFCAGMLLSAGLSCREASAAYGKDDRVMSLQTALRTLTPQDWARRQEVEKMLNENKAKAAVALTNALDSGDPQVQKNAADILLRMSGSQDFIIQDKALASMISILKASHNVEVK